MGRHFDVRCDMESLFLLAFGEEEFIIAFAMACSEAFFNNLLGIRTRSREGAGCPFQCAACYFSHCRLPKCPACKPNSDSSIRSRSTKAHSSRGGPTLLCNHLL